MITYLLSILFTMLPGSLQWGYTPFDYCSFPTVAKAPQKARLTYGQSANWRGQAKPEFGVPIVWEVEYLGP